jgi:hypothetical protein
MFPMSKTSSGGRLGTQADAVSIRHEQKKTKEARLSDNPARSPISPSNSVEDDRKRQLNTLIGLSEKFGDSLSHAFAKNIAEGKKFDNVIKSVRQSLVETGLRLALAPLQMALSQSVKGLMTGALGGALPLDGGGLLGGLVKGLGV